jgi:TonB family protein
LDRNDHAEAIAGFAVVAAMIDGAEDELRQELDEFRFLAVGFRDLSTAMREARAPQARLAEPAPVSVRPPPTQVTPPIALRQEMPRWVPPDGSSRASYTGAIRVSISAAGRVESASILRPSHPFYDRILLQAAMNWEYKPAQRDGLPISSEQVVEVQLRPHQ